jgi:hypothetical protein
MYSNASMNNELLSPLPFLSDDGKTYKTSFFLNMFFLRLAIPLNCNIQDLPLDCLCKWRKNSFGVILFFIVLGDDTNHSNILADGPTNDIFDGIEG